MKNQFTSSISKFVTGAGSLALVTALAGCGIGAMSTASTAPEAVSLSGNVHGGEQGVAGATVVLYAVGTTGYGSNAISLMNSGVTVTTDQFGSWSITGKYACPSMTSQVYLVATGGNPGLAPGTNNTAIELAAALGNCGNLMPTTGIDINEVSTVAAAFALGQYFGTTTPFGLNAANTVGDSFGAPNTTQGQTGITNAMATTFRLSDYTTGNAVTSQTLTGTGVTNAITTTVDATRVYTIANILSSCVNTTSNTSSTCGMLFGAVAPNGFTAPTNTLQAAVYMSLNPTSNTAAAGTASNSQTNLATLFALQPATAPFVGATTQPNDWTVGINYAAPNTATQSLINAANGIAVDASGNIWITNYNSGATTYESISGFSPTGAPIANVFNSGATAPASMSATTPRNIAIDQNGNILATTSSGSSYVFSYNYGTGATSTFAVSGQGYGLAIDGSNDIFVGHNSSSSNLFSFDEYVGGALATTDQDRFPTASSTNATTTNQYASVTTAGNVYFSAGGNNATQILQVSAFNTSTCTGFPCTTATATVTPITSGTITNPYGMAGEKNGGLWIANNGASNVTYVNGLPAAPAGVAYGSTASFSGPIAVAVDGANVAWFGNKGTNTSISEITTAGTILSPVVTTNGTATTGSVGFVHSGYTSTINGIAVDPSGNVWVSNGAKAGGTAPNSLFELVGAGAPTITPVTSQFKAGVTPGTRP